MCSCMAYRRLRRQRSHIHTGVAQHSTHQSARTPTKCMTVNHIQSPNDWVYDDRQKFRLNKFENSFKRCAYANICAAPSCDEESKRKKNKKKKITRVEFVNVWARAHYMRRRSHQFISAQQIFCFTAKTLGWKFDFNFIGKISMPHFSRFTCTYSSFV